MRPYDFNKYGVGNIRYPGGSPNGGMKLDPMGYQERNLKLKSRNNAILRRLKAGLQRQYMSSDWLSNSQSIKGRI